MTLNVSVNTVLILMKFLHLGESQFNGSCYFFVQSVRRKKLMWSDVVVNYLRAGNVKKQLVLV